MDVERTIQFLLENTAQSAVDIQELKELTAKNEALTRQLIGLMSQQTTHAVAAKKQSDRDTKEMKEAIKRMSDRIEALVASTIRGNGHGRKRNGNGKH